MKTVNYLIFLFERCCFILNLIKIKPLIHQKGGILRLFDRSHIYSLMVSFDRSLME